MNNKKYYIFLIPLILILFITVSKVYDNKDNYVILVSFDGFRYDYMERVDTPYFDFIKMNGVKAKSLKPIFPTFTFPNHYAIATGCYSNKHKILGNEFYSVSRQAYYSYKNSETVKDGSWYKEEPIWTTAEKNNIITATYFWVGSEAKIGGYRPSYYKNYTTGINPRDKVDQVINWLKLPLKERPKLVCLYFNEPDHAGHVYGANSKEVNQQIQAADSILGYLLNSLKNLEIYDQINLVIVSDHGMVDVSEERLINLDDYLNTKHFIVDGKGPIVNIRYKNKTNHLNQELKIPNLTYYTSNNVPDDYNFSLYDLSDVIFVADQNWMIYTNKDVTEKGLTVKGMHGYDPDPMEMHGIFYAYGPSFKNNYSINTFELIHIYPILCNILDIAPNSNIDGDIKVLENILQ